MNTLTLKHLLKVLWIVGLTAVVAGCASSKKTTLLEGTTAVGLPPVPVDLTPEVYSVDAFLSVRCAEVPSGLRNCQDILRREAERELIQLLEAEVDATFKTLSSRTVKGDDPDGGFSEDTVYLSDVVSRTVGHLTIREHESPIFELAGTESYGLRVMVVREELDWTLWGEIVNAAERDGRDTVEQAFETARRERFDSSGPDVEKLRKVERDIAAHFAKMWNTAMKQGEGK